MSNSPKKYTRITTKTLAEMKSKGEKISMLTAYDFTLAGIIDKAGIDVILVGPLPTPALTVLGKSLRADFSVMITASHNPYKDNGLKFFSGQGLKISPEDENKIEDLFFNYDFDNFKIKPSNYGKAIRLKNALGRYSEALKQSADRNLNYSKLKVTLDCANGASYKVAPEVLFELGLALYTIGNNPNKNKSLFYGLNLEKKTKLSILDIRNFSKF